MTENLNTHTITELIAKQKGTDNKKNTNPYIQQLLDECKTGNSSLNIKGIKENSIYNHNSILTKKSEIKDTQKAPIIKKYDKNNDPRIDNTLFVGNISLHISEKDLLKKLELKSSDIESIRFRSLPIHPKFSTKKRIGAALECFSGNSSTKNAYIILKDKEMMKNIIDKFSGITLSGNCLRLTPASKGNQFSTFDRKRTVFIGGLPKFCTEDELRKFVNTSLDEECVNTVRIIKSSITGKPKGFGFVLFKDRKHVLLSIRNLNNTIFKDSKISVTKALSEDEAKNKLNMNNSTKKNKTSNKIHKKPNKVLKSKKKKSRK